MDFIRILRCRKLHVGLTGLLEGKDYSFVAELKDRNRGMILLLIEKKSRPEMQGLYPF
jgi:hypothetical protein